MNITIEKITPIREGEAVVVSLSLSDGEHEEKCKREVATDLFFEMGLPMSAGEGIEIDREKYEAIDDASELTAAIIKGASLIGFAENTKKSLVSKLISRGFSKDISLRATDYLEKVGYINEKSQAEELFFDLAEKRLYGPSRIRNELYRKGFADEAIENAMQTELDFDRILAERIEKTIDIEDFAERAKRQRIIASLMRYGFSVGNIKNALMILKEE